VFISYRRDDVPEATARIRDGLAARFGPRHVFMDVESLLPGGESDQGLANALERSDVLLVIIGSRWKELLTSRIAGGKSDFVRTEIAGALERKLSVIPVRVGDQGKLPPLPRADELPSDIREFVRYQSHDVTYQSVGRDINILTHAIAFLREEKARKKTAVGSSIAQRTILLLLAMTVAVLLTASAGQLGFAKALSSIENSGHLLKWFISPDFSKLDEVLFAFGHTFAIALWGVVLAGLISLPLALASSGNLSPGWIAWPTRRLTQVLESTEAAILGALFALPLGLSPFTAVLAICVHNTGTLSRLFSEAVESADPPIANVRYGRATGGQTLYAVLPEVLPRWAGSTVTRLGSAIRAAIVLDIIIGSRDGGGIGLQFMRLVGSMDFSGLSAALIVTVSLLIIVDVAARQIGRLLGQP
jgi:phosphonate transport system permease protein